MYRARHTAIKMTWGSKVDCLFYADYEDLANGVIKVSDRSDYASNEEKHVQAIKYVANNYNHDWVFFCDDDTFVNTDKLSKLANNWSPENVHGSLITGCWPHDRSLPYCSGGAGYLIHKNLLKIVAPNIAVKHTDYSDVTLGLCLRDLKIICQDHSLFKSQPPAFYGITPDKWSEYISFHYIKTKEEMESLMAQI